jgi:hypothetical protein
MLLVPMTSIALYTLMPRSPAGRARAEVMTLNVDALDRPTGGNVIRPERAHLARRSTTTPALPAAASAFRRQAVQGWRDCVAAADPEPVQARRRPAVPGWRTPARSVRPRHLPSLKQTQ